MYHNKMKIYTYLGMYIDLCDVNSLVVAIRKLKEKLNQWILKKLI